MSIDQLCVLFIKGVVVGFAIAAPVGAIAILCIRRTLAGHYSLALATGLGAGVADIIYGSVAAFGLASISNLMNQYDFWIRLVGGLLLLWIGFSIFRSGPVVNGDKRDVDASHVGAFLSSLILTLTNPITILAFAAVFAAMGVDHLNDSLIQPTALIAGVALGACGWWISLSTAILWMRHMMSDAQVRWINHISGLILLVFALYVLSTIWI